ncbi:MAG: FAD-binding oxidoreductase [Euryarchaeota archaeon]|nr:FAD-binding oxidoreductase [Euryarchaeota archaeon]
MAVQKGSPWLSLLNRERIPIPITANESTDTVVIGGGIAGLSTAFYLLHDTDREVVLLEANLVAHGATGHSAGSVVASMEKSYNELIQNLDEECVAQGYRELRSGWHLLEEILEKIGQKNIFHRVKGMTFVDSQKMISSMIEEADRRAAIWGEKVEVVIISNTSANIGGTREVESEQLVPPFNLKNKGYTAAMCVPAGVLNAALFTNIIADYLLDEYPDRFHLYEKSRVRRLRLGDEIAATVDRNTVFADNAVLCTNGYIGMEIESCEVPVSVGNIKAKIGFMSGWYDNESPASASFFKEHEKSYYYVTNHPYSEHSLTTLGGPEKDLASGEQYNPQKIYDVDAYNRLDIFGRETLDDYSRDMEWHGLMGYVTDGIRLVGPDPNNPNLMYNLGCNGIGILASLAGGWKVAQQMCGITLPQSMFDPCRLANIDQSD